MKKSILAVVFVFICIHLAGCSGWTVRTSSSRKARVDQEVSGNQGFIFGEPSSRPKEPTFTDRKVYKVEIELPEFGRKEKKEPAKPKKESAIRPAKEDKALWGNRGYILGGPQEKIGEEIPESQIKKTPVAKIKEKLSQVLETKPEKTAKLRTYKVKKGDTLQKISRKFYGTTKKWSLLYEANKNELKSPDSIYPGQVLVIPEVDQFRK